jgi:hypothetical protein
MCDAFDAIDESIIPTLHDNSRASPFYIQDIKNFSAFKNTLFQVTGQFTNKSLLGLGTSSICILFLIIAKYSRV